MSPFSFDSALTPDPIARELDAGERILWSGHPNPERMRRKALPMTFIAIPCFAFMLFAFWDASKLARMALAAGRVPHILTMIFPVLAMGALGFFALMAVAPLYEAIKARRTFYLLTNRRALIIVDGKKKDVQSVLPNEFILERCDLEVGGDIILKRETKGSGEDETTIEIGFYGIENPHEVENLALQLKQKVR
ncbi:hypothetical protein EON83_16905 [bacterium]|nr:MAG: hypothetical protein EON83_16905 [bacterium]